MFAVDCLKSQMKRRENLMNSTFIQWIISVYQSLKQAMSRKFRSVVGDFIKAGIVLLVIVLVQSYRFLHERWKGILEAVIAAIIAALFLGWLL